MGPTEKLSERYWKLVRTYAQMKNVTCTQVTLAVLASKTLSHAGYKPEQNGSLTDAQLESAAKVLEYWISASEVQAAAARHASKMTLRKRETGAM